MSSPSATQPSSTKNSVACQVKVYDIDEMGRIALFSSFATSSDL